MAFDRDKPWHKNASNLLVVNSILAAVAAIVIQTFVTDPVRHNVCWLIAGALSLFLFVLSAEKITEAFASDDVKLFVRYCLPYNLGVLFLLLDAAGIVRHYGHLSLFPTCAVLVAMSIGWLSGWGCDSLFLLFSNKSEFASWIRQLEGDDDIGPPVRDQCDRLWAWLRSRRLWLWLRSRSRRGMNNQSLPHAGVYARLRPSPIHGVGVFAICPIKKGTELFPDDDDEIVWVDEKQIMDLPQSLRELYEDFAIIKNGRYGCPTSFNRLTVAWYLNDSDHPNVAVDAEYRMTALCDIPEGDELTIDSSKFSLQPYKSK